MSSVKKWQSTQLGDLVSITGGGTPDRKVDKYWRGSIPWATVKDIQGTHLGSTQEYITKEGLDNSASNIIPAGTVIMPTRMALGKAAIFSIDVAINQDLKALSISDPSTLDRDYLLRFLLANSTMIEDEGKGATVKGITINFLKRTEIPLPPLSEQKRIAAILDSADAIRQKRKTAIAKLDELVQSVFLEMFGDPLKNDLHFPVVRLADLTSKIGSGATPTGGDASYIQEGITLIRSMNIYDNHFEYKDLAHISTFQANKLSNVIVEEHDVLLNITGASVCRCSIVPTSVLPARVNQHVAILRPIPERLNSEYLVSLLTCMKYKAYLLKQAKSNGATREALTRSQIEQLPIPLPSIGMQKKFASFLASIINIQHQNLMVRNKEGSLFTSLQHHAFAGEL